MSSLGDTLAVMERAEDLFHAYGVVFNPQVLSVHRLRILRRFGRTLAALSSAGGHGDAAGERLVLAEALAEAHAHFAAGGPAELVPSLHGGAPLVQIRRGRGRSGA